MHTCKSGRHTWLTEDDASKCCNGFVRILPVEQLHELPANDITYVFVDAPTADGRRLLKVEFQSNEPPTFIGPKRE